MTITVTQRIQEGDASLQKSVSLEVPDGSQSLIDDPTTMDALAALLRKTPFTTPTESSPSTP